MKLSRHIIITLFTFLLGFGVISAVHASEPAYQIVKTEKIKNQQYHVKDTSGFGYDNSHREKIISLKDYDHSTLQASQVRTYQFKQGKKNVRVTFYYVTVGGKSAWVWNGYLASGRASFDIKAPDAIAMDDQNGKVLYSKNGNTNVPVASMIKILTVYMTFQKIANHKGSWNNTIKVPENLAKMSVDQTCGGFELKAGNSYKISDLYQAAMIDSSNAATTLLGIWVSGSNTNHIKAMRSLVASWGIKDSYLISASGLDNTDLSKFSTVFPGSGSHDQNLVSVNGIAVIARHLINEYPQVLQVSSKNSAKVAGQTIDNVNTTLPGRRFNNPSLHIDGLKNGYTDRAGYCFVGTGHVPGKHRLITVVVNDESMSTDTNALMKHVYSENIMK
ncbi:D-alanyl-D-alanine carboxypeptidase family protein [Pediococcus claussenii]|uniref:D-alanyl-D-alanine carboxypeptidase family protein n=1 Tax=Pediococcus claussenii (strain ATCC BAA-344 / DSM 14800 / JCM 18046 / KCTC 3811 / LMG 21948 / P06) TaxID=701521 RepID=G8PA57_PEDCP|nr:serine hydrolase [Pediococcus claussenii]AEV94496.1 D-alanyl-D-alanine carboxypeptidase family protein [Pediococcus claussenii ATCC BAA-344]ANZ69713.1 hypothetical protein AYR57_05010 [Pediococcus claussenii]ANZ71530.1 hypothetical protein AYR58_05015 [Pediococcus claussenii]